MSANIDALPFMRARHPALTAAIAHVPALAAGATLLVSGLPVALAIILTGLVAALLAWLWLLPLWWCLINLLFVPLLWLAMQLQMNADWYLLGFMLLLLTSLGAIGTRVPLYLSSRQAVQVLAEKIPANGSFIDLGCGLGGPLAELARLRPDVRLSGVEAAPLNWLFARLRLRGRAQVSLGSLWGTSLASYDVVYAYLSPAPMAKLWEKARTEMKKDSQFISNSFAIPETAPHEIWELQDLSHAHLLIWKL